MTPSLHCTGELLGAWVNNKVDVRFLKGEGGGGGDPTRITRRAQYNARRCTAVATAESAAFLFSHHHFFF